MERCQLRRRSQHSGLDRREEMLIGVVRTSPARSTSRSKTLEDHLYDCGERATFCRLEWRVERREMRMEEWREFSLEFASTGRRRREEKSSTNFRP